MLNRPLVSDNKINQQTTKNRYLPSTKNICLLIAILTQRYIRSMLEKLERFLFYPVLVIATVLALQSWTEQPVWFSIIATVIVALLWLNPLLPKKFVPVRRVLFGVTFTVLILGILWIFAWTRA
jgi:hypothetical protein